MRKQQYSSVFFILLITLITTCPAVAQDPKKGGNTTKDSSALRVAQLQEVVVTGQYEPQSMKRSVYQVRTISAERIRLQGATNLAGVLNNELGIRFSNDRTLGTTDIELMGMSGRNVKVLLDGVPMIDRGDTRESLNQVDINTIERVEIVEGPMSVSYGSDALAGVISIITKKPGTASLSVTARIQEETAGGEYNPLLNKGQHNQYIGVSWQKKGWQLSAGGSHNDFGGWKESRDTTDAKREWHPKEQWLGHAKLGYHRTNWNAWYRLDLLDETILNHGPVFSNNNTTADQNFFSTRYMHQAQAEWRVNDRLQLNGIAAYTDYERRTQTTMIDLATGKRTLSAGQAEQDKASFNSTVFRATAQYRFSSMLSLQPGVDINLEKATGARILGSPSINDYAFFVSAEFKPLPGINIRPGLRFIKNPVYDAPPVIPSVNTKFDLGKNLDLRLAYAHGFRSPALRELYFYFFDASHSIKGNPDLKAEYSNSFNGSLTWQAVTSGKFRIKSTLGAFYNDFRNQINYGYAINSPDTMTYINIDKFRTTGGTFSNAIDWQDLQATIGFSYIGRYNRLSADTVFKTTDLPTFTWSPEFNTNLIYNLKKIGTKLSLFYKYTGKRPVYQAGVSNGQTIARLAETASFHWADLTANKSITKYITLSAGVKNIFDVTTLANTVGDTGGAHSSGAAVPLSYGRSYFLGLNFQWSKQ